MQISISILVGNANSGISYVKRLIRNFKARVLSYPNSIFEAEACLDATLEELNGIGLLDNASLIITPNAYNEGILYDVIPNTPLGDMDVVRATTATRVNAEGLIEVVPRNLLTYSEQFENANWVKNRITITSNATTSPDGTTTADLLDTTANGSGSSVTQNINSVSGTRYNISLFVKRNNVDFFLFNIVNSAFTNGVRIWFNINTKTISSTSNVGSGLNISNTLVEEYADGWLRLSTSVIADDSLIRAAFFITNANGVFSSIIGDKVYLWGAQLDQGSTATEYYPTTTRLNIPRIDYTNGICPSILVEPQRTNLALYSEEFDNAYWTKDGTAVVTANTTISPNGTLTAYTVSGATGTSTTNTIRRTFIGLTTTHTSSVFVKSLGATTFSINNRNGITGAVPRKIVTLTSDWQRVELSSIIQDGQVCFGGSDGDFAIYGAQLEAGSYPTSYIPTIASTVTRNADAIYKIGIADLIGQTEGTFFIDFQNKVNEITTGVVVRMLYSITDGTNNNRFSQAIVRTPTRNYTDITIRSNNVTVSNINVDTPTGRFKIAVSYKIGATKMFINGVLVGNVGLSEIPIINRLFLGCSSTSGGENANVGINTFLISKTALTDAECVALTTL